MESSPLLLGFILVVLIGLPIMLWSFARSRAMLEAWAADNGFTILARERRYLRRGPFFWNTGRGQDVYYVTVRTPDGIRRSGFVKCGGFWLGLLSDAVQVRWDD